MSRDRYATGLWHIDGVEDMRKAVQEKLGDLYQYTPNVLRNAANNTARRVRDQLLEGARERYAESDEALLSAKQVKIRRAREGESTAWIYSKGTLQALSKFYVAPKIPQKNVVASAHVLEDTYPRQFLGRAGESKAFVVRFDSGHIALVRRMEGQEYIDGKVKTARRILGMDLTRIQEFRTVSVPTMLKHPEVVGQTKETFHTIMVEEVEKQITKFLKKGAKK